LAVGKAEEAGSAGRALASDDVGFAGTLTAKLGAHETGGAVAVALARQRAQVLLDCQRKRLLSAVRRVVVCAATIYTKVIRGSILMGKAT